MVDNRGRKRGEHSKGEDRPEPERTPGSGEWLLQQLSDGRLKSIFDAPQQPTAAPETESEAAVSTEPDRAAQPRSGAELSRATELRDVSGEVTHPITADPVARGDSAVEPRAFDGIPPRRSLLAAVGTWPGEPVQSETVDPEASADPEARIDAPSRTEEPSSEPEEQSPPAVQPSPISPDSAATRGDVEVRPVPSNSPEPDSADTVYQWPDPRAHWDEPPVWEDIVAWRDETDDDGGDEELWRETTGAYAWNLEPTDTVAADQVTTTQPAEAAERSESSAAPPFTTAPASAHVNASQSEAGNPQRASNTDFPNRRSVATESTHEGALARRTRLLLIIAIGVVLVLAALVAIGVAATSSRQTAALTESTTLAAGSARSEPRPVGTWVWNSLRGPSPACRVTGCGRE
ncbi:hypothetical protein [Rathayibacter toxicus]|uniref:Uncharacterized protein n=1 Tax=Rathayibacter toxicus TaxID=145458 RepID=A0A0C5BQC9_9MICO|nr:hypothetical protein [Rathayibacter toxicus]AJM76852.1 hypothetical protein TI83_00425 [Rathayibacter toxicus]ALS57387.1 hypothetical protein APU90_06055 [Rathayibacter toxicus]KKM45652.1 hypothetical protein VT73_05650 [Rathayibacter toxicus]PPG24736.1 hypothetical protein C5D15_00230 [Rathayibacter toxicus]PPG48190.1 hypothetical protein C5D16_00240 [Rathayibacter toxicus]